MRRVPPLCAAALALALSGAAPAAARLPVKPKLTTPDVATLLSAGVLTGKVNVRGPRTVTVQGFIASAGNPEIPLTDPLRIRFTHATPNTRSVSLPITAAGRAAANTCAAPAIRLVATARGTPVEAARTLASAATDCYAVGLASRSISPDANGTFGGQPVYLGGYGIGANPILGSRPATGILGRGPSVRAIAVSDRSHHLAVADIEVQGWFVANKDGPYGLLDMRKAVQARTGGALKATEVIIQSDHSHGGADPMGVWGGVPVAFRQLMFERTVQAIAEAYANARPARLYYGTADGADLLSNQFSYDAANQVMDSDVRVLQARDGGRTLATLMNFSAHATVLGSGNTKITGDWPQEANPLLEQRFGGQAMTMVGTLGRTQPADRGCHDPTGKSADEVSLCSLGDYAGRVVDRAAQAAASAQQITGAPKVAAATYLVTDPSTNAVILGADIVGDPIGLPLNRSFTPPWLTGNIVGTITGSALIGDVLLSSMPGEAYPQMPLKVRELVTGLRGYMTAGLADDQLGYLIAPYEAYPEPIRRTVFNQRGDEVSPIDNDNYAFNVSPTMGVRVVCSLLRGAGQVRGRGTAYRDAYEQCLPFANDLLFGPGADVTTSVP